MLLFRSEWSYSTGANLPAVLDNTVWPAYLCTQILDVLNVVNGAALNWTLTPNVLRVKDGGPSGCGTLIKQSGLPISASHWGRLYFRDDETQGVNNHFATYSASAPIQLAVWNRFALSSGTRIFLRTYYHSDGSPTGSSVINSWTAPDVVARGVWYRYEWHMEYVNASTYRVWPRLFDVNGNLVYNASHFQQSGFREGTWSIWNGRNDWTLATFYAAGYSFGFSDVNLGRNIGLGQEGSAGSPNSGEYFYIAAVEYRSDSWVGPINPTAPSTSNSVSSTGFGTGSSATGLVTGFSSSQFSGSATMQMPQSSTISSSLPPSSSSAPSSVTSSSSSSGVFSLSLFSSTSASVSSSGIPPSPPVAEPTSAQLNSFGTDSWTTPAGDLAIVCISGLIFAFLLLFFLRRIFCRPSRAPAQNKWRSEDQELVRNPATSKV